MHYEIYVYVVCRFLVSVCFKFIEGLTYTVHILYSLPMIVLNLGNRVWIDANGNGLQDSDEFGMPGINVTLVGGSGNYVADQSTDADGFYRFEDLLPGSYSVENEIPDEYIFTPTVTINTFNFALEHGGLLYSYVMSHANAEVRSTAIARLERLE